MKTHRKTAIIVGILFIIGTVSGILSAVVTAPIMAGSTFPLNVSASETQWIIGTLLILLMGFPLAAGVLYDTSCHSGNGLCYLDDREGIQSIGDRCPVCENRIAN
jgi:hypothetical protein